MPVDPSSGFLPGMLPLPEEIDDFHAFRAGGAAADGDPASCRDPVRRVPIHNRAA